MDLKKEYNEDLVIDGVSMVLDFVTNEIKLVDGQRMCVITRRYTDSSNTKFHVTEERIPCPAPAAPVAEEKAPKKSAPKKSLMEKITGKKSTKKSAKKK